MIDQDVDDFLAHFGVKGMRWGVRNETRSAAKQEKREAKAAKYVKRADDIQAKITQMEQNPAKNPLGRGLANRRMSELKIEKQQALKDAQAKREGKLTDTQRKVLVGAGVAAAVVATTVTYKMVQSGEGRRLTEKGKSWVLKKPLEFKQNPLLADSGLDGDQIHNVVVKNVNPKFGSIGTKMNCRRCTMAYEMRRRGYDVNATRSSNASGQNAVGLLNAITPGEKAKRTGKPSVIARAIKENLARQKGSKDTPVLDLIETFPGGAKRKVEGGVHGLFEALKNEPDGSRGEVGVGFMFGGAHSMAYEIVKGKVNIFDAQTGKRYLDSVDMGIDMPFVKDVGITRLDNLPLNSDFLLRWVKNAN